MVALADAEVPDLKYKEKQNLEKQVGFLNLNIFKRF
jgi:hypothetical protein